MRGKRAFLSAAFLVLTLMAVPTLAARRTENAAPAIRDVEYQRAIDHYNNGRYEEALEILKPYVEKRPIPEAYYLIAYSLYKLERNDEANGYFKQAFLLEPTYSPTPALEERLKEPLRVARPGEPGMLSRIPEYPPRAPLIPRLIEDRPEPERKPEPSPPSPPAEPAPSPAPPAKVEEDVSPLSPPPAETPSPAESPAPEETETAPAAPEPLLHEVQPAPIMETPAEKELLAKATEKISKTAEELLGEGQRLSKEALKLRERPEIGELKAKLKVLLEKTDAEKILRGLVILLFVYLIFSYFLYRIAKKFRVNTPWLSFVPVFQAWTFIRTMDKSLLLSLFLMSIFMVIPALNVIAAVYVWRSLILLSALVPFAAVFAPALGIAAAVYAWMGTAPPSYPLLAALLFVPVLNALASLYVWTNITGNMGRSSKLGLLILLPGVNVLLVLYLAFAGMKRRAPSDRDMLDTPDVSGEPPLPDLGFDLEEGGASPMSGEPGGGAWKDPSFGSAWEDK